MKIEPGGFDNGMDVGYKKKKGDENYDPEQMDGWKPFTEVQKAREEIN